MNAALPLAVITAPRAAEIFYADRFLDPIVDALGARGIPARVVAWYDDESWERFGGVLLRSPWDLYWHADEFTRWLQRVGAVMPVANPVCVVQWGFDKRYLIDLAARGVPTVATQVVDDAGELPGNVFVIKPALSGGGKGAGVFSPDQHDEARAAASAIRSQGGIPLLQPYLFDVDTVGERGLIFLGGRFSHAISKKALLSRPGGGRSGSVDDVHPDLASHEPTAAELDVAAAALAVLPETPVFARIDMISTGGVPTVIEVEVLDPDLFFDTTAGAFDRYIQAVAQWYAG